MNPTLKRLLSLLLFISFILAIIIIGLIYQQNLFIETNRTFNPFPYIRYLIIFPIILGSILATPKLYQNFKIKGSWKIDWLKIIVIGLPTFFLSILPIISTLPMAQYIPSMFINPDKELYTISGIILGYSFVDSFYKIAFEEFQNK